MENFEFIQIKNAIDFSKSLVVEEEVNLQNLFLFIKKFNEIYDREKAILPYHINLIDELHADENAHSRIFAKLLRFRENDRYTFLEKFLNDVCEFKLSVIKPEVKKVDSCGRIDIPIFDEKFVVLIENKVTDKALDQNNSNGGQLARYIETIRMYYGRDLEDIFVVYTPRFNREPSDECWVNKDNFSYKNDFSKRYCSLSYRDKIYPWLKNGILPFIDGGDVYLRSAVEQYIDYLEGVFSLRTIDKNMNMKLQEFIKRELGLEDDKPVAAIEALSVKEAELNNAFTQIQQIKSMYNRQIVLDFLKNGKNHYKQIFLHLKQLEINLKLTKSLLTLVLSFNLTIKALLQLLSATIAIPAVFILVLEGISLVLKNMRFL